MAALFCVAYDIASSKHTTYLSWLRDTVTKPGVQAQRIVIVVVYLAVFMCTLSWLLWR